MLDLTRNAAATTAFFGLLRVCHQVSSRRCVPAEALMRALAVTTFNALTLSLVVHMLPCQHLESEGPRLAIAKLVGAYVLADVTFFSVHVQFHRIPWLYRHVHKWHHVWSKPTPVATLYAHPIENVGCNVASVLVGPWVLDFSQNLLLLWLIGASAQAISAHSGQLTFTYKSAHDKHHSLLKCEFGVGGLMDWIWGTRAQDLVPKRAD